MRFFLSAGRFLAFVFVLGILLLFFSKEIFYDVSAQEAQLGLQSDIPEADFSELNQLQIQSSIGAVDVDVSEVSKEILEREESVKVSEVLEEDKDQDGIPDDWERIYLGNTNENAAVKIQSRMRVMSARGESENMPRLQILSDGTTRSDSDGDGLSDLLEFSSGTHPAQRDSDQDGIDDGIELTEALDPLKIDSDGDQFPDFTEIAEKTDPKDPASKPTDSNSNGISDVYEEKYALTYAENESTGWKDLDSDGLPDRYEYYLSTDPRFEDSDGDSLNDLEEVLDFDTNPLQADNFRYLPLKLTTWLFNEKTNDVRPIFRGIGRGGEKIELLIDDNHGNVSAIGIDTVSANGRFIVRPDRDLNNGFYSFMVREVDESGKILRVSNRVQMEISADLDLSNPDIERLDEFVISEQLVTDLEIKVVNRKPVLSGTVFPGAKVFVYWKSLLLTSTILVDYDGQNFQTAPPQPLESDEWHEVSVYATLPDEKVRSGDTALEFQIVSSETLGLSEIWRRPFFWIVILVSVGVSPFLVYRLRRRSV